MKHDELIRALKDFYEDMDKEKLSDLGTLYHDDVIFRDPVQQVDGLKDLEQYLGHGMENIEYCRFTFDDEVIGEKSAFLSWQMRFAHPKISSGAEIVVPGVTHIVFDEDQDKIREHTDHYDLGALIYEHVPVLGWLTGKVKERMKGE